MMHVADAPVLATLARNPEMTITQAEQLEKARVSVFSTGRYRVLGARILDSYPAVDSACRGFVDGAEKIEHVRWPGFRVSGWAWNPAQSDEYDEIAIVNSAGRIVGLGVSHSPRPDVAAAVPGVTSADPVGWSAYVGPEPSNDTVYAYAISTSSNSACKLSGRQELR
jgi:hypothetical protein